MKRNNKKKVTTSNANNMKKLTKKEEFISKAGLKKGRGWTDAMIKKFLGDPDLYADNPHYKCAAPMQLWKLKKVERIEKRKQVVAAFETANKRKASASKAVETKFNRALEYANDYIPDLPDLTEGELFDLAIEHYNNFHDYDCCDSKYVEYTEDQEFLHRIAKNYVRHVLNIEYDGIEGFVGSHIAHDIIYDKINDAVSQKYGWN